MFIPDWLIAAIMSVLMVETIVAVVLGAAFLAIFRCPR